MDAFERYRPEVGLQRSGAGKQVELFRLFLAFGVENFTIKMSGLKKVKSAGWSLAAANHYTIVQQYDHFLLRR